jgi:hypothetical protein
MKLRMLWRGQHMYRAVFVNVASTGDGSPVNAEDVVVAAGAAVGAAAGAAAAQPYYSLPCTQATVVVGGTTYYQCGSTWYIRAYSGGKVAYTIVNPPPGY